MIMVGLNPLDSFFVTLVQSQTDALVPVVAITTQLGNPLLLISLFALALVLLPDRHKALAAVLIIALLFSSVIFADLKFLAHRHRPEGSRYADAMVSVTYSFPSGHAISAFVTASVIAGFLGRPWRLLGYSYGVIVAATRLYLIVHYFTDVVAGAAIGILMGEAAVLIAWYLGISVRPGLAGLLLKGGKVPGGSLKEPSRGRSPLYYAAIGAALVLALTAFNFGQVMASIALILAVPVFVFLTTPADALTANPRLASTFFILATGLSLSILSLFYGGPSISLGLALSTIFIAALTSGTVRELTYELRRHAGSDIFPSRLIKKL